MKKSFIHIIVLAALMHHPMRMSAQNLWVEDLPSIEVVDPPNADCGQAMQIDHSIQYHYSGLTEGCCLWFYAKLCQDITPGYIDLYTTSEGSFSVFHSDFFQPCPGHQECGSLPPLTQDTGTLSVDGQTYYSYQAGLGAFPPGYVYIVFQGTGSLCSEGTLYLQFSRTLTCPNSFCEECIPSFMPDLGKQYLVSAWAKEENAPLSTATYLAPYLSLRSLNSSSGIISSVEVAPSGPIIDGWQRMEDTLIMSPSAAKFQVYFGTHAGPVVFDDIRIFPADGSMKSYVYDPVTLRFVAELDERHFATFYEYDSEGKLVRVKKETERGIKTLKETRENASQTP